MSRQPSSTEARTAERGPQAAICAGISALVRERWGRGPSRSRAYWAGRDALLVILDDAHTESERTLIGSGNGEHVLAGRRLMAETLDADLRRIAADATGRAVRAALSQSSLDPPVSLVAFLFVPEASDDARLGNALRDALTQSSATRALIAESEQAARHNRERRADAQSARRWPDAG